MFMQIAEIISKQSTCCRLHVGSVITKNNKIISIGYNGVAKNQKHCSDYFIDYYKSNINKNSVLNEIEFNSWLLTNEFDNLHKDFSYDNELHAEVNCILGANINLKDSILYTTISPCVSCSKLIISSGIEQIYYRTLYDRPEGIKALNLLKNNSIKASIL